MVNIHSQHRAGAVYQGHFPIGADHGGAASILQGRLAQPRSRKTSPGSTPAGRTNPDPGRVSIHMDRPEEACRDTHLLCQEITTRSEHTLLQQEQQMQNTSSRAETERGRLDQLAQDNRILPQKRTRTTQKRSHHPLHPRPLHIQGPERVETRKHPPLPAVHPAHPQHGRPLPTRHTPT